jgi:glycosyltransferase involved in cell wall biosynthesis
MVLQLGLNKPFLKLEGIVDPLIDSVTALGKYNSEDSWFSIAYSGTLSSSYGVEELISAVKLFPFGKVRLHLYGKGDLNDKLMQLCSDDVRYVYHGFVQPDILTKLISSHNLLVNPRPSSTYISNRSFPSKVIEYMATGVPVLTVKFEALPDSWCEHLFIINNNHSKSIYEKVNSIISYDSTKLYEFGLKARQFVIKESSVTAVASKIKNFLKD